MLSDTGCSTLSFNIPDLITVKPEHDPSASLDFDDLLDIAHEFEFARSITHVWSCEDESSAYLETGLDGILAAIVPSPNFQESLAPPPSSAESVAVQSFHTPHVDSHRSTLVCPAPHATACFRTGSVPMTEDIQVQPEAVAPIAPTLQGWSPPDGLESLDLDVSLLLPQPTNDVWSTPWLATFLTNPSMQFGAESRSSTPVPVIGDGEPKAVKKVPLVSTTTEKTIDDSRRKKVPNLVQPSTLEPLRSRSQTNSNVPNRPARATTTQAKSRSRVPFTPLMATGNYVRPPRGGVPPHIARSVTKANILRIEKERKVMQDAFASTNAGSTKRPSVLRRSVTAEREINKHVDGGGNGKQLFDENDEQERRAAKRARA